MHSCSSLHPKSFICRFRAAYQERFHHSNATLAGILATAANCPSSPDRQGTEKRRRTAATDDHNTKKESRAREEAATRNKMCLPELEKVPVRCMTLRQLRGSVQNMQFHWVGCRAAEAMQPQIREAVDALFHRWVDGR